MNTNPTSALSPRLQRLRESVIARQGAWNPATSPVIADMALWRAIHAGQSRVQRRAAFLLQLVNLAPMDIGPDWLLAGEHLRPKQERALHDLSGDDIAKAKSDFGLADTDFESAVRAVKSWRGTGDVLPGGFTDVEVGELTADALRGRGLWSTRDHESKVYWGGGWIENHSIRDFAKVLRLGFAGIRAEIANHLERSDLAEPGYPQKENFWRAGLSICDAGIRLGARYAETARHLAPSAATPAERTRLLGIADLCERVPAHGARTFAEAVQALWFSHILTCGEDGINANSIGRLDQILHPYYQVDVAAGRLTRDAAREWMEELACKLYLDYDVQAITLGGVDGAGRCAVNDLSYLILEATREVAFIRDVSIRVNRESPTEFLDLAAQLIASGGGIPFLFNDDCFIPALTDRGIAIQDARDYAPIGCIELTIPGKANPHAVSGWFNASKCMELALFDGCDPRTGEQIGPRTGTLTDYADFEALWHAYTTQVEFLARRMVYHCNRGELMQRERGPLPCWSVLTDACIERGRDITNGGALYHYHSVCLLGTANTADSLMAVKTLVFEKQQVPPAELMAALRTNFAGHEALRRVLVTQAPKYGNDMAEVDALARRVDEHFIDLMDTMRSPLGGRYFVHLFSFLCNLHFGKSLGATPDGRLAGEPIAYSLSAQQGRDEQGVTAMLNTLSRLPHRRAAGASAAIIDLDPKLLEGEDGHRRLVDLIRAAIGMGIGQLQWNVVTVERLRQAQRDPDRYGNLPVRVAGFSQKFKLVDPDLQEHIIARTKHHR
jgi:pyruvate formate-lyase/glycerol dehydratase family glycyl radical enzyme